MSGFRYTNKNKSNSSIQIYSEINRSTDTSVFQPSIKLVNVTPVHKKCNQSEKGNKWPVSILPNLSKVFERCIYNKIGQSFNKTTLNTNAI